MLIYLLSLTMALFFGNAQPPNYYNSYSSAKEAAKASQKEMVIFFSSKTCNNCESAWSAFTKDINGAHQFVSTRMDIEDFDGVVCFNLYELKQVPSWVILSPSSEVKEKWNGGWKDASGNPTAFDQSVGQFVVKEEKKMTTPPENSSVSSTIKNTPTSKEYPESKPKESTNPAPTTTMATNNSSTSGGFILQAGYFGSETNAQKLVGDLKTKGFANFKIENVQKDGSTFYRVISNPYNSESDVNIEQQRMSSTGFKTSVKKM
ncbi:MAG: SPOR domain-containing protein [Saprospiraceae bacterium]